MQQSGQKKTKRINGWLIDTQAEHKGEFYSVYPASKQLAPASDQPPAESPPRLEAMFKVIPIDFKTTPFYDKEKMLLSRLESNNIMRLFASGENREGRYLVVEKCDQTVQETLAQRKVDLQEVLHLFRQMVSAARDLRVEGHKLHGVNPSWFRLTGNNDLKKPIKLVDLGIFTHFRIKKNPDEYTAPEDSDSESSTAKIDIWSLGVCLFWMLYRTTKPVVEFKKNPSSSLHLPKSFGEECDAFLLSLLQISPSERLSWEDLDHHKVLPRNLIWDPEEEPQFGTVSSSSSYTTPKKEQITMKPRGTPGSNLADSGLLGSPTHKLEHSTPRNKCIELYSKYFAEGGEASSATNDQTALLRQSFSDFNAHALKQFEDVPVEALFNHSLRSTLFLDTYRYCRYLCLRSGFSQDIKEELWNWAQWTERETDLLFRTDLRSIDSVCPETSPIFQEIVSIKESGKKTFQALKTSSEDSSLVPSFFVSRFEDPKKPSLRDWEVLETFLSPALSGDNLIIKDRVLSLMVCLLACILEGVGGLLAREDIRDIMLKTQKSTGLDGLLEKVKRLKSEINNL